LEKNDKNPQVSQQEESKDAQLSVTKPSTAADVTEESKQAAAIS